MGVYSRLIGVDENDAVGDESGDPSANEQGGGVRGLVSGVGRQVDEILEAAARVAEEIRTDAEAQSASYLQERRREADRQAGERRAEADELLAARRRELEQVSDELATRVKRVEDEISGLLSTLRDAAAGLAKNGTQASEASPAEEKGSPDGLAEQALLRATQLAVGGSDRAEIERVLVEQYGLTDANELLDRLLSDKRS